MLDASLYRKITQPRNKGPNKARLPLLHRLVEIVDREGLEYRRFSATLGHSDLISQLRRGRVPLHDAIDRLATALGYRLTLTPVNGAQRAAAWALKVREEIVDVTLDEKKATVWAGKGWTVVRLTEEETGNGE